MTFWSRNNPPLRPPRTRVRVWIGLGVAGFLALTIGRATAQSNVVDVTFNPGGGPNDSVLTVALAPDGKLALGGFFSSYAGVPRNRIARVQTNGALDLAFSNACDNSVLALAIQTNGSVLLGGRFTTVGGTPRNQLARLLAANGALDTSFLPPVLTNQSGGAGRVEAVAVQSDGKVLYGGDFATVAGTNRNSIARLNTNGTLDTSFNPGTGPASSGFTPVAALVVDSSQRIIVGGEFTAFNGTNRPGLARLNTNGSLDAAFAPALRSDSVVAAFAVQPDGKVVIGGTLITPGGTSLANPQRLLTNGVLDSTFSAGSGANGGLTHLAVTTDGKIVISGSFTAVNGTNRSSLARLNSDGSLDLAFGATNGVPPPDAMAVQADHRVVMGGFFSTVAGVARNNLARLNASPPGTIQWLVGTTSVVENAGSVMLTAIRTGGSSGVVSVDYAATNGTALAGSDFVAASGTLTFADGETNQAVAITLVDDAVYEDPETFSVQLRNPTGGALLGSPTNATVTILDDQPPPATLQFDSASYSVLENAGTAWLTVLRAGGSNTVTVGFTTSNGTATAGTDFVATNGVLTFGPTDTARSIAVSILDDYPIEGDELFTVRLFNPTGAGFGPASNASVTIRDTGYSYEDLYGHGLQIVSNLLVTPLDVFVDFTNRLTLRNGSLTASSNGFILLTGVQTNVSATFTNRYFFASIPAGGISNVLVKGTSLVDFSTTNTTTNLVIATVFEQLATTNLAQDSKIILMVTNTQPPSGGVPVGGGGLTAPGFNPPPVITNLVLNGPAWVEENLTADFSLTAQLNNGTNNTNVSATWTSSAFSISPAGRLTTSEVLADTPLSISAVLTNGSNVITVVRPVSVVNLRELSLGIQPLTNGPVSLLLRGTTGRFFALDVTTNLANSNAWATLATNQITSNSVRQLFDPAQPTNAWRFYRARQTP